MVNMSIWLKYVKNPTHIVLKPKKISSWITLLDITVSM
jgi:hypothetical protein